MALIRLNSIDPNATNDYLESITGKPVGTPPPLDDLSRLGQVMQGNFTYVSLQLATELGFSFGSTSGSSDKRVMTFDYASTASQDDPADNGIASWVYGTGFRVGILATSAEASAQLGLPALAATATLKNTQIEIRILRYGMPEGPLPPVPNFSQFDVSAYGVFIKWQEDLLKHIEQNRASLRPVRIYAALTVDIDHYLSSSSPLRYALRRIQDKHTLRKALEEARTRQIPHVFGHEAEIRAVYAKITGFGPYLDESGANDHRSMTDDDRRSADKWVQQFDNF